MEEEIYNIQFTRPYIVTDNFKQKQAYMFLSMVSGGRMREFMNFKNWAHIDYEEDDVQKTKPIVTMQDKFNRAKTNCIVFDLPENPTNQKYYDKLFIYHSNGLHIGNYGFVMLNTETGDSVHQPFIEDTFDDLFQILTKCFNSMKKREIYDFYSRQYNACHGDKNSDIPTISEYEALIKKLQDKNW